MRSRKRKGVPNRSFSTVEEVDAGLEEKEADTVVSRETGEGHHTSSQEVELEEIKTPHSNTRDTRT